MTMDTLERVAEFFNAPQVNVVRLFSRAEVRAIQAERDAALSTAEIADRGLAHAQLSADFYAELAVCQ